MNPEVLDRFETAAKAAAASIERIPRTAGALAGALSLATSGAKRVLFADPEDLPADLFAPFKQAVNPITTPTEEELRCSEIGVTEAFAGVARTGSVCISVNHGMNGPMSLLAPYQIAVLAAENLVPSPRDLFSSQYLDGKGLTRDFVFVTGPSATADMGPLVRGVHGPHKLHIILLT